MLVSGISMQLTDLQKCNKSNDKIYGYIESVIWNQKPFNTFLEISNFPMHYNIKGDSLYIIFLAVEKKYRKKGFATKLF